MAIDASIPLQQAQSPQIDLSKIAGNALGLQKQAIDLQYQVPLLQQRLASELAAQKATEEGTLKAIQEREEQARQLEASRYIATLYKRPEAIDKKTGKVNHDYVYEEALRQGVPLEALTGLRTKVNTIRADDLKDTESRLAAKEKLTRQLDMEVAKAGTPQIAMALMVDNAQRLKKLGFADEDIEQHYNLRYGNDMNGVIPQAQARLQAELTPIKSAELQIAQEAAARAKREEIRGVGLGAAEVTAGAADVDTAIASLDKLQAKYGTKLGTIVSQTWDKYIDQPGELGAVARAAVAYEKRTGQKLDIRELGYAGVREALSGERNLLTQRGKALEAGAPPEIKKVLPTPGAPKTAPTGKPSTGTVRMMAPNGSMFNIPADRVEEMKKRGLKPLNK